MSHHEQESLILIVEDDESNAEVLALLLSIETS
jgi:CheY-like chemotaxis protein